MDDGDRAKALIEQREELAAEQAAKVRAIDEALAWERRARKEIDNSERLARRVVELESRVAARDAAIDRMERVSRERDRRDIEMAAALRRAHAALDAGGAPNGADMTLEDRIKAALPPSTTEERRCTPERT